MCATSTSSTYSFRPPEGDFAAPRETGRNGYTIVEWQKQDLLYRAVSDLNASELNEFMQALNAGQPK